MLFLSGPHKCTILEFLNFEFPGFKAFVEIFKFTIVPYRAKSSENLHSWY